MLIGDALHTAHYSIGSGTRLAIEDALALAKALEAEPGDVPAALARYEAARRPIVEKLVAASKMSAAWYDRFAEHMRLEPLELAMSYITRSGRIDDDRLRAMSPRFMALYDALARDGAAIMSDTSDHGRGAARRRPGTQEIGFSVPDRYNASAILFDNLGAGRGDRCAVTGPAGRRTYAELAADAARFGAGLQSLGLQRGDRVLLFLDDTPAYPAALFGAIRAGLVPLLINTLTPPDLLQFYLADSAATVAICDAAFVDRFNARPARERGSQP